MNNVWRILNIDGWAPISLYTLRRNPNKGTYEQATSLYEHAPRCLTSMIGVLCAQQYSS